MDATATALSPGSELLAPADLAVASPAAAKVPTTPLEKLKALPPKQRWTAAAGLGLLLVMLVAAFAFSRPASMRPLFLQDVSERDAGAVAEMLTTRGVPHTVSPTGRIMVPAELADRLRIDMAKSGYPKNAITGYERLDNPRFGQSQHEERTSFKISLEGELARTIQTLGPVEAAKVLLAMPASNGFFREQVKTTASVTVKLRSGHVLDRSQLAGIVHLVSKAVPDLSPKDVSVIDQDGALLSQDSEESARRDMTQQQRRQVAETEQTLQRRVHDILEPAMGKENQRATVTVDMDFNQVESTSEAFRPNQKPETAAVRSQLNLESNVLPPPQPTGVPGAVANQPPTAATAPLTGASDALKGAQANNLGPNGKRESQINYEVDRKVELVRSATGVVRRLNVAVVVNHRSVTDAKGKTSTQPVPAEELEQLTALVQEAVGFNKERGDSVKVLSLPFRADLYPKPEELPVWKQPWLLDLIKTAGVPLVLLLVALTLVFAVIRPALKKDEPPPEPEPTPALDAVVGGPEALPAPEGALVDPDEDVSPHMAEQLEDARVLARNNPLAVANILRTWMNGEEAA